jgi:hypothetical protein
MEDGVTVMNTAPKIPCRFNILDRRHPCLSRIGVSPASAA